MGSKRPPKHLRSAVNSADRSKTGGTGRRPSDVTPIRVIAAVIEREGRWLLGRRPQEKRHGGLWEFPGGKIDPGETPSDAARRELDEELAMRVDSVGDRLLVVQDRGSPFIIEFFQVSGSGTPKPLEHSEVGWFGLAELRKMPLAPADSAFVEWLSAGGTDGP